MERAPFPDVTGLRLLARSRTEFETSESSVAARGRASLRTPLALGDLARRAAAMDVSVGTLVTAAWGVVLYMYMKHECEAVTFDAMHCEAAAGLGAPHAVSMGAGVCDVHAPAALVRHVAAAWHSAAAPGLAGPTAFIDAVALRAREADVAAHVAPVLHAHPALTLVGVAHADGDGDDDTPHLVLTLYASAKVHVAGSAMLQLEQVHAALCAMVRGSDPMAMPRELQSIENARPVMLDDDMPSGAEWERLEDQFVRRARAQPQEAALRCCASLSPLSVETWTYEQLDRRSDEIARVLWSSGVGHAAPDADSDADQVVVLCMAKCMDMYAAILGVLKAGCTWCPIDPGWPAARQSALIVKAEARVALTTGDDARVLAAVCPADVPVVRLDAAAPASAASAAVPAERRRRPWPRACARHLAYKIWTSGTTGLPKAVGIEHVAAVQGMRALSRAVPTALGAGAAPGALRYLQFAAYVFDLSIFDMFYAWAHGGTVCFAPLDLLLTRLVDVANALQVTHTLFTPAVSAMVPRRAIPTMRVMINGGEKLSQVVADEWSQGCRVVNIYGPAEATLSLTMREVQRDDEVKAHNIGRAFADALCVLVDGGGRVVPRGCIGELLLGGPQLARGYIGDADKTRDKFVHGAELGRLYHTGDLARQLWTGELEYLGRNDDQVKINGVRIELLEINAAVKSASDAVRDADTVALPGPDAHEPPRIVAFAVCPRGPGAPEQPGEHPLLRTDDAAVALARALRAGTQAMLPAYMVPFHFVILSAFPRTSSAKIDRRAVRAMYDALDLAAWEAQLADVPGAGDGIEDADAVMASALAQCVCAQLPQLTSVPADRVSPTAAFPLLGVNSVRAMALSARLVDAGFDVSAADIARHDSLAKLVRAYASRAHVDADAQRRAWYDAWRQAYRAHERVAAAPDPHARIVPATPLQQGMLLETHMDASRYWLYRAVHARTAVSAAQLAAALGAAARAIDCLRLGFLRLRGAADGADGADGAAGGPPASVYDPVFVGVVHAAAPRVRVVPFSGDDVVRALRPHVPDVASGAPPWFAAWDAAAARLVLVLHHALYDAPTLDMIMAHVDAHLAAAADVSAAPSPSPPPPLPPMHAWTDALADLVPAPDAEAASLEAWRRALHPVEHATWPTLRTTKAAPRAALGVCTREAAVPWPALEHAAAQLGTSVRPLAHVAWARVLSAYLGTHEVVLGDVVSLRARRAQYATTGGPLLATLPVCVRLEHESVGALVQAVHAAQARVAEHACVPLSHIRTLLACARDQPLFASLFVLEISDSERARERVLAWHTPTDMGVSVEHALALEVRIERDQRVSLALSYDDAHVCSAWADTLLAQFDAFLTAYAHDAAHAVRDVPRGIARPLLACAEAMEPPPALACVNAAQWVETHAHTQPHALAVEMRSGVPAARVQCATYAELHAHSMAVAAYLAAFPRTSVVGVAVPRSLEMYACVVGILRAGLVYLPLDEALPHARRVQLLTDSEARVVLTASGSDGSSDTWPCTAVAARDVIARGSSSSSSSDPCPCAPDDPAYVLYTSGSTGRPKGCILSHANLAHAIDNFRDAFGADTLRQARFLARSAEAFDVHLLECLLPWRMGAAVVTMPRAALLADLGAAMADARVTHACVVPSLFFTHGRRVVPRDVPTLTALVVGGEKMADDIVDAWCAPDEPGARRVAVLNAYGPTEATIGISCTRVHRDSLSSDIGTAFAGNEFFVRARDGRVALRGEAGELCIAGTHVGLGYVRQASDAFFAMPDGRRAYATGDLARMMPHGGIEYLGRVGDDQVKVRGARVELGEVDAALRAAGAPHAATLLLTHAQRREPHLVAFVAPHARVADAPPPHVVHSDTSALMHALRTTLSTYMVPSVILALTHMPLARVSGKLDRRALAAVYAGTSRDVSADDDTPPRTPEAIAAADAVQRVLGAAGARVGMHTDLFGVGLDSLKAVRLAAALEQVGVAVPLAAIMAQPTLAGMLAARRPRASALALGSQDDRDGKGADDNNEDDNDGQGHGAPARSVAAASPLTSPLPLQSATLAQSLAEPSRRLYVHHVRITLASTAHAAGVAAMQQWHDAMAPFATYRTVFRTDARISMHVLGALPRAIQHDRAGAACTDAACDAVADDILAHIDSVPPVRLVLYAHGVLCLSMHHALYDAASLDMLVQAVCAAPAERAALAARDTFADVVRLAARTAPASAEHYAHVLDGMVCTPMPNLSGRYAPAQPSASHTHTVRGVRLSALHAHAQAHRVTLQSLVLHAFVTLLAAYVGEDEATLGVVLSGRMADARHADAHGPCITTVPFRWRAHDDVHAVHAQLRTALQHQFVHLTDVAHALGMDTALFDVLFSFLPAHGARTLPPGVRAIDSHMHTDFVFALQATADDARDVLVFETTYAPARVPPAHAALLCAQLGDLLCRAAGTHGGADAGADASADAALLSRVHAAPREPCDADAFLARFARHVRERPDATALTFATSIEPYEATSLTYAELDALSTQYAAHIAGACDGPAVYVHLPRCVDLYVVLLAAWMAHKVYVPLDPALPLDRLQYMVETVGHGTLITQDGLGGLDGVGGGVALPTVHVDTLHAPCARPTPAVGGAAAAAARLDVPAYILFTSGSTGKPKGVQISHRALAAALVSWDAMLPYTRDSRLLQLASPGFDVSLFEVCLPLGLGFSVASAPKDVLLTDLEAAFRALRITMADLPAALAALVHPANVLPMEWLMSGGDVIDERVVREWGTPPQRLINAYGPTEGTIGNTLGFVDAHTRRSVVGNVYPTTALYICARDSTAPVYTGAVGEIVVGGPQVADAYVGAPDLTAAKFPTLPSGQRLYRTGDRGRLLADGRVECLGRMERGQVKVNGQRVELDEIAHELKLERGIADAAVLYVQHPAHASKQLVAFLALDHAGSAGSAGSAASAAAATRVRTDAAAQHAADACVRGAARRLAPYMVPAHALVLTSAALPLTPNNKVDVKCLAAMYAELDVRHMRDARAARALTPTERTLVGLLAEFTGAPASAIDRDASFYALGIDSLSAIRLVKLLRAHGMVFTVSELLAHATPARVAAALDDKHNGESGSGSGGSAATQLDDDTYAQLLADAQRFAPDALPCTPLQAGMLAQSAASDGALYVHTHAFRVHAAPDDVSRAWAAVVARHAMLRTTFHAHSHAVPWVQRTHAATDARAALVVMHGAHTPLSAVLHLARASVRDVRTHAHALHIVGSSPPVAVWAMHHALYDAHALALVLDDVDAALRGTLATGPGTEAPPFARLLPHLCSGLAHVPFWVDTLRGYVPVPLAPRATSHAAVSRVLDTGVGARAAEDACRRAGVSVHTLATLAYAYVLAECMHTSDVCFGQVLSLRADVEDATAVCGPALNTTPTRVQLTHAPFAAQLAALQRAIDAARPHRHAPLRAIAAALQKTQPTPAPLIDALLDVQHHTSDGAAYTHMQRVDLAAAATEDAVQYALNVEFQQTPTTIVLSATARTAFCDAARLDAILRHMRDLVAHIVAHPDADATHTRQPADACPAPAQPVRAPPAQAAQALPSVPRDTLDQVRTLMADVARVPVADVAADTPLLTLGLDSIAAIQVVARARAGGMHLHVSDLAGGTPHAVAAAWLERTHRPPPHTANAANAAGATGAASAAGTAGTASAAAPVRVRATPQLAAHALARPVHEIQAVRPLAPGQVVHVANLVHSHYRHGVFAFVYTATKHIDTDRLARAWHALQMRHETLRTVFACVDHELVQVVVRTTHALRTSDAACADAGIHSAMHAHAAWDAAAPWCALECVRAQRDASTHLVLTLFHGMYDAWSLPMLVHDLEALYDDDDGRPRARLPPCASMDDMLAAIALETHTHQHAIAQHWAAYAHAAPCVLGGAHDAHSGHSGHSAPGTYTFVHRRHVLRGMQAMRAALAQQQLTLPSVLLAAWAAVLHDELHTDVPVFGVFLLARSLPHIDLTSAALPCLNMQPIAIPHSAALTSMAQHAQRTLAARTPLEQVSLADIHRAHAIHEPRFNTLLNVLAAPASPTASAPSSWLTARPGIDDAARLTAPPQLCAYSTLDAWRGAAAFAPDPIAVDAYVDADDSLCVALRCPAHVLSDDAAHALLDAFTMYVHAMSP